MSQGTRQRILQVKEEVTFDFVVNDPGMTLFHCHQQLHMDFGFMTLLSTYEYGEQADFAFENKGVVIGGFVSAQLHSSEQQGLVVLSKYVLAWGASGIRWRTSKRM